MEARIPFDGESSMLRFTAGTGLRTFKYTYRIHRCRSISSTAFSRTLSIPFQVDKQSAQNAFQKHHSGFLKQEPTAPPPAPKPIYLPYYIFSANTSLTYTATLSHTTHERRYNILRGRWEYYPRIRTYQLPRQTLSPTQYDITNKSLHIYGSYTQPVSWLNLDTADVSALAAYRPLTRVAGETPTVEEFVVPIEGAVQRVQEYLHRAEEERARKYIQRTYDPTSIRFDSSILNVQLSHQQIYIPVWHFEFTHGTSGVSYSTYVAGWNGSTSGPVFYQPELSGLAAGLATVVAASLLSAFSVGWVTLFSAFWGGAFAGVLFAREYPSISRNMADRYTEQIRQKDTMAAYQQSQQSQGPSGTRPWWENWEEIFERAQRQRRPEDPPFGTGQQSQRQRTGSQRPRFEQTGSQQQRTQPPPPRYAANDVHGLYKTLEVPPTASETEIRDAFRRLARKYHPDMIQGDAAAKDAAKKKFQEVSAAYDVLRDPRRRREYDKFGTMSA